MLEVKEEAPIPNKKLYVGKYSALVLIIYEKYMNE